MEKDKILVFEGNYDKKEFYGWMGDAFSSKDVRKELPYLYNEPGRVWFLYIRDGELAAFASVQPAKGKALLKNSYVYPNFRESGLFEKLNLIRIEYAEEMGKPFLEVASKDHKTVHHFENLGFSVFKQTTNYTFLKKKVGEENGQKNEDHKADKKSFVSTRRGRTVRKSGDTKRD